MSRSVDAAAQWIYGGVWGSIVALFRVPHKVPILPAAGEPVRSFRPAPGYLLYLKFFFWVALIPGDVLPFIGWIAITFAFPLIGAALVPLLVVLLIAPDVVAYIGIHLRYHSTWYVVSDRSLRIRRGILIIRETTISFENVQNVEVRQGPVQRYFGIADLVVQTAGGGGRRTAHGGEADSGSHVGLLEGVDDAEALRELILDCVRRSRSTGLGDEHPTASAHAPGGASALSPAHVAILREIRDTVRRISQPSTP